MNSSPILVGQHRVMQMNLGQAGNRAHQDVFDAGLLGGGDGDAIAIAPEPRRDPQNMNFLDRRGLRRDGCGWALRMESALPA